MPCLKDLIAVTLRQIAEAQGISNRYSHEISRDYEGPLLEQLPIPHAVIAEIELEMQYALAETDEAGHRIGGEAGSFEIIVEADRLERIPERLLNRLCLKVELSDGHWSSEQDESPAESTD